MYVYIYIYIYIYLYIWTSVEGSEKVRQILALFWNLIALIFG